MKVSNLLIVALFVALVGASECGSKQGGDLISISFDNPFPLSSFARVNQLSKQVWADVILYKQYQVLCTSQKPNECKHQKVYLDHIVDRLLDFHHVVKDMRDNLPAVVDDVGYISAIVDRIEYDFSKVPSEKIFPEQSCISVVLSKIKSSLGEYLV